MRIVKRVERWFPAPNDPDDSEHLIRHLTPGEILDTINNATNQETKYRVDEKSKGLVPEMASHTKPGAISLAQFLLALVDWKNMFDAEGAAMACSEENKIRAYREIDGYAQFISECREKLHGDITADEEARTKN
ncbi:MAG: hypothetical protein ABIJ57_15460 [Pseudomonadota bacterium]